MHQQKTNHGMWHFKIILLMCMLFSGGLSAAVTLAADDALTIMVEDAAPPWSKNDGTGYANDVVVAAFKEMAVEVQLKVVPYARCKHLVLNGNAVACFNMTWLPEFEGKIKLASLPIHAVNNDIFENINAPLPKPPHGTCSLPPGTIVGVARGYEYSSQATSLKVGGVVFESANSDLLSLKKLAAGRLPAALITTSDLEVTSQSTLQSDSVNDVQFAFNCGQVALTIGFSLAHPDGLRALKIYDEGYRRIKANGELRRIHMRWFPRQRAGQL